MIIPKLKGGLGNQMFQIATAYAAAKRNSTEYGVDYNLEHLSGQGHPHLKYKNGFFKNVKEAKYDSAVFEKYDEPHFHYARIPDKPNVLIDGYFQSDKYFSEYADDIASLFYFEDEIVDKVEEHYNKLRKLFEVDEIVCIHVRRGEYLLPMYNEVHIALPREYYIEAMKSFENTGFVVISDDIKWCEQNLNGDKIAFCNSGYDFFTQAKTSEFYELFDMRLAMRCNHNIISPSSFSWWGAWLGKSDHKVIAPKEWFKKGGFQDYYDVYCEGWLKI
jgi:hypothetical protein